MTQKRLVRPVNRLRARPVSVPDPAAERPKRKLRTFHLGEGLPSLTELVQELYDMRDVLMGRVEPPIDIGVHTLQEVAEGYYARGMEITSLILEAERKGTVMKGSGMSKFRTGELRYFCEMAKSASDLGSRRLTAAQLRYEMENTGRESRGHR